MLVCSNLWSRDRSYSPLKTPVSRLQILWRKHMYMSCSPCFLAQRYRSFGTGERGGFSLPRVLVTSPSNADPSHPLPLSSMSVPPSLLLRRQGRLYSSPRPEGGARRRGGALCCPAVAGRRPLLVPSATSPPQARSVWWRCRTAAATRPSAPRWRPRRLPCPATAAARPPARRLCARRRPRQACGGNPLTGETRPPGMSRGRVVNSHATPP